MKTESTKQLTGEFYKALLDCLFDAVFTVDNQGFISYWNESCARISGFSSEEMLGKHCRKTLFGSEKDSGRQEAGRCGVEMVLETGMSGTWKGYIQRKNGQRVPIESHISALRDEAGEIIGAVEVFRDVSAHVALEDAHRQLLQLSREDQLTGLYNRSAINDLLNAEIERSRRYRQPLSVIMIDIDLFKRINDRYGHDAGDKVLAKIGAILRFNLRKPDVVGRWGGEEFLVVAPASDAWATEQLAERLRGYMEDIPVGEVPEPITASFGVAELSEGLNLDEVLYAADNALYAAKHSGRNRVVTAPPSGDFRPEFG